MTKILPRTIESCVECPWGEFTRMAPDYILGYCKRFDISMYNEYYDGGIHPQCKLEDVETYTTSPYKIEMTPDDMKTIHRSYTAIKNAKNVREGRYG